MFKDINRVEILKVILISQNLGIEEYDGESMFGFVDVDPSHWYMQYIQTGVNIEIFQGDEIKPYIIPTTARPGDTVNRAEALKLLFEARAVAKNKSSICSVENFEDISDQLWFAEYSCLAREFQLFELENEKILNAANFSSRGEIVLMLHRLYLSLDS